jgi:hypothetical protein
MRRLNCERCQDLRFPACLDQTVFLVTLVDIKCARPSNQFNVDIEPIVRRLRKGLRDYNYVGVIEPGLYSHITIPGTNLKRTKCISWHLHALVWGISRKQAKHLAAKLNGSGKYIPIAPNQAGADQLQVRDGGFATTLAYLLKRPKNAYRLGLFTRPISPHRARRYFTRRLQRAGS